MIKSLYYRFLYRRIMKLAHKYGWHHMRTSYILDETTNTIDTLVRCEWCGLSTITHRQTCNGNSGIDMIERGKEK